MRIFKNRLILGILAMVLALIVSFAIYPLMTKLLTQPVEVVRVKGDIQKGGQITKDNIEVVLVGAYNLTDKAVRKQEDIIDKYSTVDLTIGSYVMKDNVTDEVGNEIKLETLNGEYLAVSFAVPDLASSVSSQLKAGDIVSVITVDDENNAYIPPELKYIEILNCISSTAKDTDNQSESAQTKELISTITVFASERQAIEVAKVNKLSKVHLALVYRGKDDNKQALLDIQKNYLAEGVDVSVDVNDPPTPSSEDTKDKEEDVKDEDNND